MKLQYASRYNRNASGSVRAIALGTHLYNGGIVSVFERNTFGVYIFAAITRYGKSTLVKNWYASVAQSRGVIVLDYLGEHTMSKFPNFLSEDSNIMCVPEMVEIKDFKFKISQFYNEGDWFSLTFTEKGCMLMADLAKNVLAHRDDPQRFYEMLDDVPVQGDYIGVSRFEKKWGFTLAVQNSATVDTCKARLKNLQGQRFFAEAEDPTYDFGELYVDNPYMNINFNLGKSDVGKGRAIAGKVLEQIRRRLAAMYEKGILTVPPLIVVEEADVLAPAQEDGLLMPSSTLQLVDYVIKLQKFNIEIGFIVQDPQRLHPAIVGNRHTIIYGQLPDKNEQTVRSRQLVWDIDRNYREFIIEQTGVPGYQVFKPFDSSTMY